MKLAILALLSSFVLFGQAPTCAAGSTHCVQLNAGVVGNATSYNVYRSTVTGGCATVPATLPAGCTKIASGGTTPAYLDNSTATNPLTEGTTYFYVETSVDSAGESGPSNEASAKIPVTVPIPPPNLTATPR